MKRLRITYEYADVSEMEALAEKARKALPLVKKRLKLAERAYENYEDIDIRDLFKIPDPEMDYGDFTEDELVEEQEHLNKLYTAIPKCLKLFKKFIPAQEHLIPLLNNALAAKGKPFMEQVKILLDYGEQIEPALDAVDDTLIAERDTAEEHYEELKTAIDDLGEDEVVSKSILESFKQDLAQIPEMEL